MIINNIDNKAPTIAAIDVGTNSFHLVIASIDNRGLLNIITRDKEMVRLGASGSDMKYLSADAIERGVNALKNFTKIAESEKASIRVVATSAVREAINKSEFIEQALSETGIGVEVISGAEEGRLIYIGALHALPIYFKKTLVIDIGGGSTETIVGYQGDILRVNSEKLGAIRLTKRFFENGYSNKDSVKKCREYIKGEWSPELRTIEDIGFDIVVGCSGTIHTLARMAIAAKGEEAPDVLNGITIETSRILKIIDSIVRADNAKQRTLLPGIDPTRSDIILAGSLILEYFINKLSINKILISPYALREGIVFDTISKAKDIQEFKHLSHLRFETIKSLSKKFQVDDVHSEHVKNISLKIFDHTKQFHKLSNLEREMLEASALLHDAGYLISHDQHHKHSYYIITHSDMPGFTNDEAEIIGNIARYHRKSHPKKKHENFSHLSAHWQQIVKILSGILRLGEGIDRRRKQFVRDIDISVHSDNLNIKLIASDPSIPPDIEIWGAKRRTPLLEESLGINIFID